MIKALVRLWRDIKEQRERDLELAKMLCEELKWANEHERQKREDAALPKS